MDSSGRRITWHDQMRLVETMPAQQKTFTHHLIAAYLATKICTYVTHTGGIPDARLQILVDPTTKHLVFFE